MTKSKNRRNKRQSVVIVFCLVLLLMILYLLYKSATNTKPIKVDEFWISSTEKEIQYTVPARYTGIGIFVTHDGKWLMSQEAQYDDDLILNKWYIVSYCDNGTQGDESDDYISNNGKGYRYKLIQLGD